MLKLACMSPVYLFWMVVLLLAVCGVIGCVHWCINWWVNADRYTQDECDAWFDGGDDEPKEKAGV